MRLKLIYLVLLLIVGSAMLPGPPSGLPVDEARIAAVKRNGVTPYQALMWETKRREGFSALPYDDLGVPAVGYGVRVSWAEARKIRLRGGLTEGEATAKTAAYYEKALIEVDRHFPGLRPNQRLAVASFIYTTGMGGLQKKPLWRMLKRGECSERIVKEWRRTACGFRKGGKFHFRANIQTSRKMESALWMSHLGGKWQADLTKHAEFARSIIIKRK